MTGSTPSWNGPFLTISLIICTRDRGAALARCLGHVASISYGGAWEAVVVDNGSRDETSRIVRDFAATARFPVIAVHQAIPGLSNARNAGVAAASGDLLFFTDDDCYVDPGILDAAGEAFADPSVGYATGRIRLHDSSDFPTTINESSQPGRFPPRSFLPAGAVKGANLAFRRETLEAIGPFDPLFGSGALFPAEDVDAAMRASLAGWSGVYAPRMIVHHHHGRKTADMAKVRRAYDIGRGAYHAKLLGLKGGFVPALRAWGGLPRRVLARPSLLQWELHGAWRYWRAAKSRRSLS